MMRHFVWIGHPKLAERLMRQMGWRNFNPTHHILSPEPWMLDALNGRQGVQGIFQKIRSTLMEIAHQDPRGLRALRETTVTVLLPSWAPASWTPDHPIIPSYEETREHYYTPSQAMDQLVLAFPEVRWFFLSETRLVQFLSELHKLTLEDIFTERWLEVVRIAVSPLFDGSGLRSFLRQELHARHQFHVDWSRLHRLALSVDEEPSYAFFESYAAFRTGYRSIPITTERDMHAFLGSQGFPIRADIVFEDLFINFPDRTIRDHLSILKLRDQNFPRLRDPRYVRKRVLVTVGHHQGPYSPENPDNQEYIQQLRSWGVEVARVLKPLSGLYAFAQRAGLRFPSLTLLEVDERKRRQEQLAKREDVEPHGHSAPGMLTLIARLLLRRARALLDIQEELTVEDAVHGAVLALEAKELLAGRTPTLTLQALALQHELEVIAESRFYGVEAHIDVDQRVEELDQEIQSIAQWFHPSQQEIIHRNAMTQILTRIMRRLEEVNLVEEAERTLHHIREQERKMRSAYRRSRPNRWTRFPPLYHAVNGFWWYVNKIMVSPTVFLFTSLLWILLFGVLYSIFPGGSKDLGFFQRGLRGLLESLFTFLSFSPMRQLWPGSSSGIGDNLMTLLLSGVEGALGFLHFGVLVSYLYRLLARR